VSRCQCMLSALVVLLMAQVLVSSTAWAEDEGRLPVRKLSWEEMAAQPGGQDLVERELERQRVYQENFHQVHDLLGPRKVSKLSQKWLAERGLGYARFGDPFAKAGRAGTDTLRILLVRIAFEENRDPNLVTMAEDGDFFLEPHPEDDILPIDPWPHNRNYFESHLKGLSEFYKYQSGGRLHIESRVLPEGDEDSYKLSDVADYGPGSGGFWTLEGLESLVRDMITTSDAGTQADGSADLSDFDDHHPLTYIIFAHAGSDWQSDINQDSPNDIPTFFVTLGEPQDLLGGGELSECSVIPETTTQDGFRGSIAAALYHEFGHALGLPDVYDASTGLTSVGVWDLMDSGTNLSANIGVEDPDNPGELIGIPVTGILPPSLSAWCKWFLGWVEVGLVTGGEAQAVKLPAVGVPREQYEMHNLVAGNNFDLDDPQIVIGGPSSREFFIVENRWVPRGVDDTPYDPYDPETNWGGLYFKTDTDLGTGVILYLGGDRRDTPGINTGYYDYFLPEGGTLVWHVDMDRIEAGLDNNVINQYHDGLKLVEADGIQDIGVLDAYVLGWYGSDTDPFSPWNTAGYNELFIDGPGVPTSRANDRSYTGLRLADIADDGSAHGAVMSFEASLDQYGAGWPLDLPAVETEDGALARGLDPQSLVPLTSNEGDPLLVAVDKAEGQLPVLFIYDEAGEQFYTPPGALPAGAAFQLADQLVSPPAVLPSDASTSMLVLGTADGVVRALDPGETLTEAWATSVGDTLLAGPQPVFLDDGSWLLFALDGNGLGHLMNADGEIVGDPVRFMPEPATVPVTPLRVVQLDAGPAVLLCYDLGWRLQPVTSTGFGPDAVDWLGRINAPAEIAVLPRDDDNLVLIYGPDGLDHSLSFDGNGAWAMVDWPDPGAALSCEPAVADLDGDGNLDLIAASGRRLFAWQDVGTVLTGFPLEITNLFPLPDTTQVAGPLVVADLTGGPANELALATKHGHLMVLKGDGQLLGGMPQRFGDPVGSQIVPLTTSGGSVSLALASNGGLAGAPLDRRLTHGRLALFGDHLLADPDLGTAGWYGLGGGPQRSGPVGEAQQIEGDSDVTSTENEVVYYPNPLTEGALTVRFWSASDAPAKMLIYNLEGELVTEVTIPTMADRINEYTLDLDVASGLYVARLSYEKTSGSMTDEVKTLAVAR